MELFCERRLLCSIIYSEINTFGNLLVILTKLFWYCFEIMFIFDLDFEIKYRKTVSLSMCITISRLKLLCMFLICHTSKTNSVMVVISSHASSLVITTILFFVCWLIRFHSFKTNYCNQRKKLVPIDTRHFHFTIFSTSSKRRENV